MPFDEHYFSTCTYKDVSFARFHQYWWSNRFYAILARKFGPSRGRLLEIGSGLGHLVQRLEKQFDTFACDVNLWALQQSTALAKCTLHSACGAQDLPYAEAAFNVVILKHVVEHLPDPERAIYEVGRITRPGGVLILATPNLASRLKPLKGERWIGYQDPTHISLKQPGEWLDAIQKAGFAIRKVYSDGFWDVPYIKRIPVILQKLFFGAPGGLQAVTGIPFLPLQWGESMLVIAQKDNQIQGKSLPR